MANYYLRKSSIKQLLVIKHNCLEIIKNGNAVELAQEQLKKVEKELAKRGF